MGRYITTKADFTLRRKHKKGSGVTIYEHDYTTINPMPNAMRGEYVIGDSNFVFTSRLGLNAQKKHVRGKFLPPPLSGDSGNKIAWTVENIGDSGITTETKIRLKPNYNSIGDFACYGSAIKLLQGTVNGVIVDFPAEFYLSDNEIKFYAGNGGEGYSFNEWDDTTETEKSPKLTGKILYNEYGIDLLTENIQPESVYNPLRYFTLCGSSYTYLENGVSYDFVSYTIDQNIALGACYKGQKIEIDKIATCTLVFEEGKNVVIDIFKNYDTDETYYVYTGESDTHIRPKKEIIENYFLNCDDFTEVLLNRESNPIYTSTFETPVETDTGVFYGMKTYTWPSTLGGFNPDLSGPYSSYLDSLMKLCEFYDEYYSDNIWRSLTHEAIKTLDWTYVSNEDGDLEDRSVIDTSRIEPITKIYGRQFDDLKRYADAIKSINAITYNQKSNTPDYTLSDVLDNSGWETKTLKITSDKDIHTNSLYPGLVSGYTSSDANNEFFRRLKLNSRYLFSIKGTRKGLDAMLGLFGIDPEDYDIHEYVAVFSGDKSRYGHFCDKTEGMETDPKCPEYPLSEDVVTVNKYKNNFNPYDPYGDYCGIPVTEVGYFPKGGNPEKTYSYVIPWFSYGKKYDDGLYFQMHGGWGKVSKMNVSLEIAPDVTSISGDSLYKETQARMKFARDFDELLQQAYVSSHTNDIFYVTDISKIESDYSAKDGEDLTEASHYFILENEEYNQFLGYSEEVDAYGWRSIELGEIQEPNTAGTLVLYLESIIDDTTGNNPHIGNGTYDDGMGYLDSMSEIFGYSVSNKNFIGIDESACTKIKDYNFDVEIQEDNRKCWFFSDNHNFSYGKDTKCTTEPTDTECCEPASDAEKIYFREGDVSDTICDITVSHNVEDEITDENYAVNIGVDAKSNFSDGSSDLYTRGTDLNPFNPESGDKNGEAAANSVVNL